MSIDILNITGSRDTSGGKIRVVVDMAGVSASGQAIFEGPDLANVWPRVNAVVQTVIDTAVVRAGKVPSALEEF